MLNWLKNLFKKKEEVEVEEVPELKLTDDGVESESVIVEAEEQTLATTEDNLNEEEE
jgi:hypothetical protein